MGGAHAAWIYSTGFGSENETTDRGRQTRSARDSRFRRVRCGQPQPDPVSKGDLFVRYINREFAHTETLDRAHKWLIQAGFDPGRIEVHHHGIPRIAVAVEPGEAAGVEMVINAAESADPDGLPSFWDLARQHHIYAEDQEPAAEPAAQSSSASFVVGWRPVDSESEVTQASTDVELQKEFRERWPN